MDQGAASHRYASLDGLRGVAAVMVMLYHAGAASPLVAPAGYLAVDMFFALSGFVIANAYEERLRAGLSLREFTWLRLARIYPMYLAGAVLGAVLVGFKPASLLLIPDLSTGWLFPANVPMWSLLFELGVNIAFAALTLRVGRRGIAAILAVSAALMLSAAFGPQGSISHGGEWGNAWLGIPRTVFSFTLGAALLRLHRRLGAPRRTTLLGWVPLPLLAAALAFLPAAAVWWELACVFALFPALLWCAACWELPRPAPAAALGNLSYPLYCIHAPLLWATGTAGLAMAPVCTALVVAAWLLDRWIDRPARKALAGLVSRGFAATRAAAQAAS